MVICEVMASYEEGGLENHFIALCNGLVELGHEVHVIVDRRFRDRFTSAVTVHTTDFTRVRIHPLLLIDLVKIVNRIAPDVIHTHAGKATRLMLMVKPWLKSPCVATLHNLKKSKALYSKADAVIGVSRGVLMGVDCPNTRVIYNGIADLQVPQGNESVLNKIRSLDKRAKVFAVGRLVPVKGFDLLIRAWVDVDADLVIMGDGPEKKHLEGLIAELGLEARVHLIGFVENAGAYVQEADLLVISSYKEGFNYVMAEALRSEVPVISTDVPAPNEIIPSAYLVPKGDVKQLASRIEWALGRLDACNSELAPLYAWAADTLTLDNMVKETANYLQATVTEMLVSSR